MARRVAHPFVTFTWTRSVLLFSCCGLVVVFLVVFFVFSFMFCVSFEVVVGFDVLREQYDG